METKKLYKIDSRGKTRIWYGKINPNKISYTTYAGLIKGKLISRIHNVKAKGKNTTEEQTIKEMLAKERYKINRELYQTDIACSNAPSYISPQAALDYTKVPHRLNWERHWITQAKLNGVRCTVKFNIGLGIATLTSKKGMPYQVTHIIKAFTKLYLDHVPVSIIFDGELYLHGVELGDVTHAVAHDDPNLLFKLFDTVNENLLFTDRYNQLIDIETLFTQTNIELVPCHSVLNETELKLMHNQYVKGLYEGAILRDIHAPYTIGQRTPGMFKYKHFKDDEFDIVGYEADKDQGILVHLITPGGILFKSRPMGKLIYRQQMLKDGPTLIGKKATVKFSELLKTGVPEFNRVVSIRDYE